MNWIKVTDEKNLPPTSNNLSHLNLTEYKKNIGEKPELIFGVPNACVEGKNEYFLGYFDGNCFRNSNTVVGWQRVSEYLILN